MFGWVSFAHAALANKADDFKLRKKFCNFLDRRRSKRRSVRIIASIDAGLHQTFRAQTHRRIIGQRFLTGRAYSLRFHQLVSAHYFGKDEGKLR